MLHDLRYALRTLRQQPGFALVAILSLALGIGASAAMFSSADGLVLRPLPVPHASEILTVRSQLRGEGSLMFSLAGVSYPDYVDLRDRTRSFTGLTATEFASFGFAKERGVVPEMRFGELVSGNFFQVLGVRPKLGRGFRLDEDRARGRDAVVVLGYELWTTAFASSPDVIGRTIYLNGIACTVIGVTPDSFLGSNRLIRSALFVPLALGPRLKGDAQQPMLEHRDARAMTVEGRLKPGVSVSQAKAEVAVISRQLAEAYPETNRSASLTALTQRQWQIQQDPIDAAVAYVLAALAAIVLLIACANVTNLMLSRARARSREIAVRLAIGAGRGRLVRQLLTESLVIAVLGGALGLLVAQANVDSFSRLHIPGAVPIVIDVRLDLRVVLFTLLVSGASALLVGLAPALQATRPDLAAALKSGKTDDGKRRRLLGRNLLVITQVAGSLALLVFAGQAYRTTVRLLSGPAGFRIDHLLIAGLNPALARYTPAQTSAFYTRLLEKARGLSGVKSAALALDVPVGTGGADVTRVVPEGFSLPPGTEALSVFALTASEGYFETIGIPLVEGRSFHLTDRADTPRVAIVNESFARRYYPNQTAVGKRFRLNGPRGAAVEIVGVAKQSKYVFILEPPQDYIYLPLSQNPMTEMTLLLETTGPAGELAAPMRDMVRSLDTGLPLSGVQTMEQFFDQRTKVPIHILLDEIVGIALVGLVLALVGLYGLMTYAVGLRRREIGIRIGIGADPASVLRMVLRQGIVLTLIGIGAGWMVSLMASKPAAAVLGAGFDLPLAALVTLCLVAVAALGAFIPARRASRIDPNLVLRQE